MLMKARLAGAQKGHGLLKKKADALQMRFRLILGKIIEVRIQSQSHDWLIDGTKATINCSNICRPKV